MREMYCVEHSVLIRNTSQVGEAYIKREYKQTKQQIWVLTKILMQFTSFFGMIYVSVSAVIEHKITGPMFGRINKFVLLSSCLYRASTVSKHFFIIPN